LAHAKSAHRRVWQIFSSVALKEIGEDRFKRILASRSINIKEAITHAPPLTKQIVDAVLMGSVKVFQEDFIRPKDIDVKWLIPSEVNNQIERLHRFLPG
jgi:hypothetical protein